MLIMLILHGVKFIPDSLLTQGERNMSGTFSMYIFQLVVTMYDGMYVDIKLKRFPQSPPSPSSVLHE